MSTFTTLLTNTLRKFTLPSKVSDLTNDKNYVSVMDRNALYYNIATEDVYCKDCWGTFGQYQEVLTITNNTITVPANSREEYLGGAIFRANPDLDVESEAFKLYYDNGIEFIIELTSNNTVYISKNNNNPNTLMTPNVTQSFQLEFGDEIYIVTASGNATFNYTIRTWQEAEVPIQSYELIDVIYPIGSIYTSINDINPSLLFGGYWEKIQGQFLLASGTEHNVGETGGSEYTKLTVNELPSHTHIQNSHTHTQVGHSHHPSTTNQNFLITDADIKINQTKRVFPDSGTSAYYAYTTDYKNGIGEVNATNSATPTINGQTATNQNTGNGDTHSNMPPYLVVHMWKRISAPNIDFYDSSIWSNTVTITNNTIACNAVRSSYLNEEFITSNYYTLKFDIITTQYDRQGVYLFTDPEVNNGYGLQFVEDIYNTFIEFRDADGTVIGDKINFDKNYFNTGTHHATLIRNGRYATFIVDNDIIFNRLDIGEWKNTIGLNKWGGGKITIGNLELK